MGGNPDQPDTVTKEATAGFNFLKLETGIRAIGMAGAQVAAGLGVEAVPYNPASIALIKRMATCYYFCYILKEKSKFGGGIVGMLIEYT